MNLTKGIKQLFNEENKTKVVGLLTLLVGLWLVLYFIPDVFTSLFNTFLGNLILLTVATLITMYDLRYGVIVSLIFIVLYRFARLTQTREGFKWDSASTHDFLLIQNSINRQKIFDVDMIEKNQASQEELDYFNKNGLWPWSQKTIELYKEALNSNPFIRTEAADAINYSRTIYNEAAILRLLSYQTKEGKFLLNGVLVQDPSGNSKEALPNGYGDFAYKSGLIDDKTLDIIKCNMKNADGATLERTTYTGKGGIYGEQTSKVSPVDYNDLENIIPGFQFVNGPCNPCGAINESPDYSCPFKLSVQNNPAFISNVWQYLWSINDNPLQSTPTFLSENINADKFPLLSELQIELNKQNKAPQK
jgi:hypothetical protein